MSSPECLRSHRKNVCCAVPRKRRGLYSQIGGLFPADCPMTVDCIYSARCTQPVQGPSIARKPSAMSAKSRRKDVSRPVHQPRQPSPSGQPASRGTKTSQVQASQGSQPTRAAKPAKSASQSDSQGFRCRSRGTFKVLRRAKAAKPTRAASHPRQPSPSGQPTQPRRHSIFRMLHFCFSDRRGTETGQTFCNAIKTSCA